MKFYWTESFFEWIHCIRLKINGSLIEKEEKEFIKLQKDFSKRVIHEGICSEIEKKDYIYKLKKEDVYFYLPLYKKDLIQGTILINGIWYENDLLNEICLKYKDGIVAKRIRNGFVLDIGANIGNHSLYFAKKCNAKKVFSFEPVKNTYDILATNININNLNAVVQCFNVGVGKECSRANVCYYDESNIGSSELQISENGNIDIISIDSMKLSEVSFIKIDTEGFERDVIDGLNQTISNSHPIIMIEIRRENRKYIIEKLKRKGYRYKYLGEENFLFI